MGISENNPNRKNKHMNRTHIIIRLALLALPALLLGCATGARSAQAPQAPPDKALVYIYKKSGYVGSIPSYSIFANHQVITNIRNGNYYLYYATPGHLVLGSKLRAGYGTIIEGALDHGHDSLVLDVVAGSTHYVTQKMGTWGPWEDKLVEVESTRAQTELKRCHQVEGSH
jgi:hypothetical protein